MMCSVAVLLLIVVVSTGSNGFSPSVTSPLFRHYHQGFDVVVGTKMSDSSSSSSNQNGDVSSSVAAAFDATVMDRYACTRFQRFDNNANSTKSPSPSDPMVVQQATNCLNLARRAPSGFNAQPYKVVLVHSAEQKESLSKYCIGHNAHRVRDSDCTAVFCADREVVRTLGKYGQFIQETNPKWKDKRWAIVKVQAIIALFSSGYPLPRILAVPFSFAVRLGVTIVSVLTRRRVLVPSLANAETWSTKNTMLVAMAYMLGCSSRGLTTCPMEGFNAGGVKKALGIPRRYSIPLIVATGHPYKRPSNVNVDKVDSSDDMGMTHGSPGGGSKNATPRYSMDQVVYDDSFGNGMRLSA